MPENIKKKNSIQACQTLPLVPTQFSLHPSPSHLMPFPQGREEVPMHSSTLPTKHQISLSEAKFILALSIQNLLFVLILCY